MASSTSVINFVEILCMIGHCESMSYHTMVQHPIGQWRVLGVLAVQILADHLDMGLLTHLLGRLDAETNVASVGI